MKINFRNRKKKLNTTKNTQARKKNENSIHQFWKHVKKLAHTHTHILSRHFFLVVSVAKTPTITRKKRKKTSKVFSI